MAYSIGSEAHACGGGSGGLATGGPLRSHGDPSRRHRQTVQSSHGEQQRRQARPHAHATPAASLAGTAKANKRFQKGSLQLLWLLAVTPSRKSYPYGRSLNAPRPVCGPRAVVPKFLRPAARLKYICCASVVRTLNATRPVHMLTKARPMSSPRRLLPMLVREVRFPLSI